MGDIGHVDRIDINSPLHKRVIKHWINALPQNFCKDIDGKLIRIVVIGCVKTKNKVGHVDIHFLLDLLLIFEGGCNLIFLRSKSPSFNIRKYRFDFLFHLCDCKIPDNGQCAIRRHKMFFVESIDLFYSYRFDDFTRAIDRPFVRVIGEKVLVGQRCGILHGVVKHLVELFEDHFLFFIQFLLCELKIEKDLLVIGQGKIGIL